MNNKMLTIAALAAVLVAGVFATTPMALMQAMMETTVELRQNKK